MHSQSYHICSSYVVASDQQSFRNSMSKSSQSFVNQNQCLGRLKNCFNVNLSDKEMNGKSFSAIMSSFFG